MSPVRADQAEPMSRLEVTSQAETGGRPKSERDQTDLARVIELLVYDRAEIFHWHAGTADYPTDGV